MQTCFALSRIKNALPIFYTGRDLHCYRAAETHPTVAIAFRTGFDNELAGSLASGAGPSHSEETLLITNLSLTMTGCASNRRLAWSRSVAVAVLALLKTAYLYLPGNSEDSLFELQGDIFANIGATLCPRTSPSPRASEYVAEAKEVAKNI